jgi:hypothetical protein
MGRREEAAEPLERPPREDGRTTWFLKWFFHGPWRNPARREFHAAAARVAALGNPDRPSAGLGTPRPGHLPRHRGLTRLPRDRWRLGHLTPATTLEAHCVRLADLVARLPRAGLCHRDLNVYHVLVDGPCSAAHRRRTA